MCNILKPMAYIRNENVILDIEKIDYLKEEIASNGRTFRFCDIILLRCTGMTAYTSYRSNNTLIYDGDLVEIDFGTFRPVHLIKYDAYGNFNTQTLDAECIENHTEIIGNKYLQK